MLSYPRRLEQLKWNWAAIVTLKQVSPAMSELFSPRAPESLSLLLVPTHLQGLKDLSTDHVPSVPLSQVLFQNLKHMFLSQKKQKFNSHRPSNTSKKVTPLNHIQTKLSNTIQLQLKFTSLENIHSRHRNSLTNCRGDAEFSNSKIQ